MSFKERDTPTTTTIKYFSPLYRQYWQGRYRPVNMLVEAYRAGPIYTYLQLCGKTWNWMLIENDIFRLCHILNSSHIMPIQGKEKQYFHSHTFRLDLHSPFRYESTGRLAKTCCITAIARKVK